MSVLSVWARSALTALAVLSIISSIKELVKPARPANSPLKTTPVSHASLLVLPVLLSTSVSPVKILALFSTRESALLAVPRALIAKKAAVCPVRRPARRVLLLI